MSIDIVDICRHHGRCPLTDTSPTNTIVLTNDDHNLKREDVMIKSKCLGLLAILFSVTACAPVVYDATYQVHRKPSNHVSVYAAHKKTHKHRPGHVYISPVEITLYPNAAYKGAYFQSIHIVITDGEYVELPVKNRRGHSSRIFAHYSQKNLHFDANKSCKKIHGSSAFKYDKGWNKGSKYTHVSAGNNYNLTGISLKIRSASNGKHKVSHVAPVNSVKETLATRAKSHKTSVKQIVVNKTIKPLIKGKTTHKKPERVKVYEVKTTHPQSSDRHQGNSKPSEVGNNSRDKNTGRSIKVSRPTIVKEIAKHDHRSRLTVTPANRSDLKWIKKKHTSISSSPAIAKEYPTNHTSSARPVIKGQQKQAIKKRASIKKKTNSTQHEVNSDNYSSENKDTAEKLDEHHKTTKKKSSKNKKNK
jgi:hypothetical protein